MDGSDRRHILVIASRNAGKLREISAILSVVPVRCVAVTEFAGVEDVEEDGGTFEANALKKAREVWRATGLPSIADDSGLEVRALNDEPGVHSARYAGAKVSYLENNTKLLRNLEGVPPENRDARFKCVACFVDGDVVHSAEGRCPGTILTSPRGSGGFGYDPLFLPDGFDRSFAELTLEEKNTISHRAKAFHKMSLFLTEYFGAFANRHTVR